MFVPCPKICMFKSYSPKVIVLGQAFEQRLGHDVGLLMNGISAFIKEAPQSSLVPPARGGNSKSVTQKALVQLS